MTITTVLFTITIVSLVLTIALAVRVVQLTRDERRRSAARVAALVRMADTTAHDDLSEVDRLADDDDLMFDRLEHANASEDLFVYESDHPHSQWPQRLGVVFAVAIVVAIATVAVRHSSSVQPTADRTASTAATAQAPGLLELMSLKHAQEGNTLTITGLVQNPRDGVPLTKVAATAYLFGADGSFIASGRAPLDFTLLRPGDESGFSIAVPVTGAVARYRVGFRDEDGRIIGHVDRRGTNTIAATYPERGPS